MSIRGWILSTAELMSRPGPIVVVDRELLQSKAFRDLTGQSVKVLLWFLAKRQMKKVKTAKREGWVIANDGEIVFSYAEAENKCGLTRQAFSKTIEQLVALGFIDIARLGTGVGKVPTLYAISERWRGYGTAGFKPARRMKRASYIIPSGKDHPKHRKSGFVKFTNPKRK